MRVILILLLMILPHTVFADRLFDGFYISGGVSIMEDEVDIFDDKVTINAGRPKIIIGYGKTSKKIGKSDYRMYLGTEAFYVGSSGRKRDEQTISETTGTGDQAVTNVIERQREQIKQTGTQGVGVRIGITKRNGNVGGNLYALMGYAQTEIEGDYSITDPDGFVILSVNEEKVDFSGFYYGGGYEFAFNPELAIRVDLSLYNYDAEQLSLVAGNSNSQTVLTDPEGIDLESFSTFIGLTYRF